MKVKVTHLKDVVLEGMFNDRGKGKPKRNDRKIYVEIKNEHLSFGLVNWTDDAYLKSWCWDPVDKWTPEETALLIRLIQRAWAISKQVKEKIKDIDSSFELEVK